MPACSSSSRPGSAVRARCGGTGKVRASSLTPNRSSPPSPQPPPPGHRRTPLILGTCPQPQRCGSLPRTATPAIPSVADDDAGLEREAEPVVSRRQALDEPAARAGGVRVTQAVVEAAGTALPELHLGGHQTPAAPVRRPGDLAAAEAPGHLGEPG